MIRCNRCGQMIEDNSMFCPNCGQPVSQGQPAPQPNQQSQNNWQQQTPPNYNQQQKQAYYTAPNGMKVRNLEMLEACKMFWTKYAVFEGRSRRAEFWWAYLMVFVINLLLGWTYIASLACLIPMIALSVRRLHDIGKSGWYYLLILIPIVGAIVGAFAYRKLIGRHLPCDICVVEEKETTTPSEQKASL